MAADEIGVLYRPIIDHRASVFAVMANWSLLERIHLATSPTQLV